jgi:TRAP-type C4-dicarboxylate transport system permease small subunit
VKRAPPPLARLEKAALISTRALSVVGLVALMVFAAMTLADGLMRWLANQPIEGVRDIGALAIAVAVSCCIPVGLVERSNITIRVVESLSKKTSRVLDALAAVVVEVVMVLMAWQFYLHASNIARAQETTWVLRLPMAPFWYGVDAILWFAVMVQAVVVALELGRCFGYEATGERAAGH